MAGGATETRTDPDRDELRKLKREVRNLRVGCDTMDLFGDPVPQDLLSDYPAEDLDSQLSRNIQKKYKIRRNNTRRCWNRIQLYLPELMSHDGPKRKVLEMSTAHGGMLEVLRHFGHEVLGNDYVNMVSTTKDNQRAVFRNVNDTAFTREADDYGLPIPAAGEDLVDWPYRRIIESIGIPMALFDGGHTPYPFDDDTFDVVMCMQSIEHYCHPKDWGAIVDEFCRIARESVVVLLNPMMTMGGMPDDYEAAFMAARLDLRRYHRNGFQCTSTHMAWGLPVGFKLTAV